MPSPEDLTELAKAANAAKEYADAILMQPLNQLGGILSDTVGYWRLKNQVRLMLKTKEWLESKGIDHAQVLPDVFVPILEDGGNTADPELSDMFASLLSCHLDPGSSAAVHPSYTKVLAQLSPLDARAMVLFRSTASEKDYRDVGLRGSPWTCDVVAERLDVAKDAAYLSCLNLHRLGIIELFDIRVPDDHPIPNMFTTIDIHQEFRVSEYGVAFCDACHHQAPDPRRYAKELANSFWQH